MFFFQTRRKELEYLEKIINNDTANPALIDPNAPLSDQVALLNYDDRWEIPRENLKLRKQKPFSTLTNKTMTLFVTVRYRGRDSHVVTVCIIHLLETL